MWPFKRDETMTKTKRKLLTLRDCHCGKRSYGAGQIGDVVHCRGCGALYYLAVSTPVAQYADVLRDDDLGEIVRALRPDFLALDASIAHAKELVDQVNKSRVTPNVRVEAGPAAK